MYRATKLGIKWYAVEMEEVDDELENIQGFVEQGGLVVISDNLDEIIELVGEPVTLAD